MVWQIKCDNFNHGVTHNSYNNINKEMTQFKIFRPQVPIIHTQTHTHIYIHTHTYTHTHTHTHTHIGVLVKWNGVPTSLHRSNSKGICQICDFQMKC